MFKWDNLQKSNIEQLEYLHGKVSERINWNLYLIICMSIYQFVLLGFIVYGKFSSLIDFVYYTMSYMAVAYLLAAVSFLCMYIRRRYYLVKFCRLLVRMELAGEIESSKPWLSEEDPFYRITLRRAYVRANIKERDDWMAQVLNFGAPEE